MIVMTKTSFHFYTDINIYYISVLMIIVTQTSFYFYTQILIFTMYLS